MKIYRFILLFILGMYGVREVQAQEKYIYWTEVNQDQTKQTLYRLNLVKNNAEKEIVFEAVKKNSPYEYINFINGFGIDQRNNKLLYIKGNGQLFSNNLDGKNEFFLQSNMNAGETRVFGDVSKGNFVWKNLYFLVQGNTVGSFFNQAIIAGNWYEYQGVNPGEFIDVNFKKNTALMLIYYSRENIVRIVERNLCDQSESIILDNLKDGSYLSSLAVNIDFDHNKVYWIDWKNGNLNRLDVWGTRRETLITGLKKQPWPTYHGSMGLQIDVRGGKIYWLEKDRVRRANLDGTNVEDVITGLDYPSTFVLSFGNSTTVATEPDAALPVSSVVLEAYPNPFRASTTIRYSLPAPSMTKLQVFDLLGREVATVHDGFEASGTHEAQWQATNVPSGVYLMRLTTGNTVQTRRVTVLR